MNIQSFGRVLVLAKNSREGSNRQVYYNLAVLSGSEAGNISCTPEAYDKAVVNEQNDVVFAFNSQYSSFRIVDIIPAPYIPEVSPEESGTASDSKADDKADTRSDKQADKPGGKTAK